MQPRAWGLLALVCTVAITDAWGWGGTAHRFVNKNAVIHLPASIALLAGQQSYLEAHASDADTRKSADTAESPKHFIDLELYPDYSSLPPDLLVLISQYGWQTVKSIGILPWATVWTFDSLRAQVQRGDLTKAYQSAADLGHYIGDGYQPLHCTVNYDGAQTGNRGIHSRYESGMVNLFISTVSVSVDSVRYVTDPYAFVFGYILRSHFYVDSIMLADNAAKAASGWNGSGTPPQQYYTVLWERTRYFTTALLQESTRSLASLWYTAWVNARVALPLAVHETGRQPEAFELDQNFPNPFNPSTTIRYTLPGATVVSLEVYDLLGGKVAQLASGEQSAGMHEIRFDGSALASGVYYYRLRAGSFVKTRSLVLLR